MKNESCIGIIFLIALCALLTGCNSIKTVQDELRKGGFALVYPAQEGIEPGQIWNLDFTYIDQRRPEALILGPSGTAKFESLSKTVDAGITLNSEFGDTVITDIGKFTAGLKAGTVTHVSLDFGETIIKRIVVGDLRDETVLKKLPTGYRQALNKVRNDESKLSVITAVLYVSGMKYTFACENTASLKAAIPEIKKTVKGEFELRIIDKENAVWEIPNGKPLAIGITPLYGRALDLDEAEQIRLLAIALENPKAFKEQRGLNEPIEVYAAPPPASPPSNNPNGLRF